MPTDELLYWIEYFKAKEEREQRRLVDALMFVLSQVFPKQTEG